MSDPHVPSFADEYTRVPRFAADQFKDARISQDFNPQAAEPLYEVILECKHPASHSDPLMDSLSTRLSVLSSVELCPNDDSDPALLWGFRVCSGLPQFDIAFCGRRRKLSKEEFKQAIDYTTFISSHKLSEFEGTPRRVLEPEDIQINGQYQFLVLPLSTPLSEVEEEEALEDGELSDDTDYVSLKDSSIDLEEIAEAQSGMLTRSSRM